MQASDATYRGDIDADDWLSTSSNHLEHLPERSPHRRLERKAKECIHHDIRLRVEMGFESREGLGRVGERFGWGEKRNVEVLALGEEGGEERVGGGFRDVEGGEVPEVG
jgi:hypothetical protein